jgi:ribosomal protein S18 acetylase RimI-like enzyme
MHIRPYHHTDKDSVIALWHACGLIRAWNDPDKDIQRKLQVQPDMFLIGVLEGSVIASVMAGYDGHRGWLNYLAVAPEHQRCGHAANIVAEAEHLLYAAGCPKINLQIRSSNQAVIDFYRRIGYSGDDVVSMGKRLEHDCE